MTYAFRLWVNDKLEQQFDTPSDAIARSWFRKVLADPPAGRFSVFIHAEEGPFPVSLRTVAMYQDHSGG